MKYLKPISALIVICAFFGAHQSLHAAYYPIPHVDVYAKSISNKRVYAGNTDATGTFNVIVPDESGPEYNIFIQDQNMPPVKLKSKNGTVTGRVVVLTENTVPKDPEPVSKKAPTPLSTNVKPTPKEVTVEDTATIKKSTTIPVLLRPIIPATKKGTIFENL